MVQLGCIEPVCNANEFITDIGDCEDCKPYFVPKPDGKSCAMKVCDPRHKVLSDGTCM